MTTYPPLPTPSVSSPPDVPTDLGAVALGIETQALAQYTGYNTTNTPSAASIEARTTAIDAVPSGSAAVLDARIASLNTAMATWTDGPSSSLSAQTARTAAFPARQDGHDSLMATLTSSLATAESQIATLQSQRPSGVLYNPTNSVNIPISPSGITTIGYYVFNAKGNSYYRASYCGTLQTTVGNVAQVVNFFWIKTFDTTPSQTGALSGASFVSLNTTSNSVPFACYGITGALTPGLHTFTLNAYFYRSPLGGSAGARVVNPSSMTVEDIGWRYY